MLGCGWSLLMWWTCLTLLVTSPGNALALLSPSSHACLPWWAAPHLQPHVTPCILATEDAHCFYRSQISNLLRLPQRQLQITKYWENTGKSFLVQTLPNWTTGVTSFHRETIRLLNISFTSKQCCSRYWQIFIICLKSCLYSIGSLFPKRVSGCLPSQRVEKLGINTLSPLLLF